MSSKSYVDIMNFSNNEIIEEETNITKWTIINKKSGLIKEAKSTQLLKKKFESMKDTREKNKYNNNFNNMINFWLYYRNSINELLGDISPYINYVNEIKDMIEEDEKIERTIEENNYAENYSDSDEEINKFLIY